MNKTQLWKEASLLESRLWVMLQSDFSQERLHSIWKKAYSRQYRRYIRGIQS